MYKASGTVKKKQEISWKRGKMAINFDLASHVR